MTKPLRILHIDIEGGFGGSSRSLAMYIKGLQEINKERFSSHVLCKSSGPIQHIYEKINVPCEVFPSMFTRIPLPKYNIRNLLSALPRLIDVWHLHRKITKIQPDIIHLNYAGLMFNGWLLKLLGYKGKIITHSRVIWPQNIFARLFSSYLEKSTDHLIAIAEPVRQAHLLNGFSSAKMSVIHNPSVSLSNVEFSQGQKHDICRISYFGTVGNLKGPERLIELADILEARHFCFDIRIFGAAPRRRSFTKKLDTELNAIVQRERESKHKYHFSYQGHVPDPEAQIISSDFVIRPSKTNDPWGRDVIEAMSHGKIIIATGHFDGFISNQINGFLIGEWNAENVADIITEVWADRQTYEQICQRAYDFAKLEFAPKNAASKFVSIIQNLELQKQ